MGEKYKKKKRVRRSSITDIPTSVCVFFIVFGLIMGSVFTIGTWSWGKLIDRSEAIPLTATFKSYEVDFGRGGSIREVEIDFTDHEKLYIDGAAFNDSVEDALDELKKGDQVQLLLHTNSNDIWDMKSDKNAILLFEDVKSSMSGENIGFSLIGFFCYSCAVFGTISLLIQFLKGRKRKRTEVKI